MPRSSLRFVVLLVAALTGLKVWAQDRYYRGIMHEALIGAYRDRAAAVCLKASPKLAKTAQASVWTGPEIVIGSKEADVAIWDYENPLWDVRYRHPHLVLKAATEKGAAGDMRCSYDLFAGLAKVDSGGR
jgi:hypothetical protein